MELPLFVAILYVNRSGSTLLSRMLSDNSPRACVLPELGFPVHFLLARRFGKRLSGEGIYAAIRQDPRFEALGISGRRLRSICADLSSDDLPRLLHALATEIAGGPVDTVVFKLETLLHVADEAVAAFPGLRFVHLHRDPRAVVNSMMATPIPEKPGFDMARGSLVYAAAHWARYIEGVRQLAERNRVLPIRYEDLPTIADHPELAAMNLFLRNGRRNRAFRIAPLDAALHGRIYGDFDPSRNVLWQDKMNGSEIAAIETICGEPMRALGYSSTAPFPPSLRTLASCYLRHGRAMVRHYWGTLLFYLAHPKAYSRLRYRLGLLLRR